MCFCDCSGPRLGGSGPSAWAGHVSKSPGLVSMQGWRELTEGRLYLMSVEEREYDLETFPSCPFNLAVLVSNESDLKNEN